MDCSLSRHKGVPTWWKDANAYHLTVKALNFDDSSDVDVDSSWDEVVPLTVVVASTSLLDAPSVIPSSLAVSSLVALIL